MIEGAPNRSMVEHSLRRDAGVVEWVSSGSGGGGTPMGKESGGSGGLLLSVVERRAWQRLEVATRSGSSAVSMSIAGDGA